MGVMLYSTGCADYDEDITALSDKINQLISGEIQPLKADLAKVKTDLEAAIAAAKAELKDVHEKDVKALQEADAALDAKLATANEKILALEGDITALKAEDKKLGDKLSALEGKMTEAEKAIDEANKAIDAVEDRATKLEAADKAFAEELKTIKADIEKLNEDLSKAVENLQKQITENTDGLATLDETVKGISKTVGEHLAAYAKFEAATNSKIAAIEGQIKNINDAIETIDGTLEDLQKQIDDNDADIEDIYTQIDLLVKADAAMNKAIGTLQTDLSTLKANLKTELEKAFGDVYDEIEAVDADLYDFKMKMKAELNGAAAAMQKLQKALEDEKTNRIAKDNQLSASLENLQKELKDQVDALNLRADAIEEAYKAADEQLQKNLDAAVKTLNDAIAAAIDESKAYTDEEIKNLKAQLTDQHKKDIQAVADRMNDVRNELVAEFEKVREEMAAMYADLNKAINCLNKSVEEIKADIAAILARVQSVVYVPEFSDGKATVEWAMVAGAVNEGTSHIDYQVYPAECAEALAEAWNNAEEDLKSFLTFDSTGVTVRSEETSFEIVAVEADEEGVLHIDFQARGLADEFYTDGGKGTQGYSISLVIANENANLSSCYTNLVANTEYDILHPALYNIIDGNVVALNGLEEITIPYTDKSVYGLLKNVDVRYYDANNNVYYTWAEVAGMGYEVERPEFKFNGIASGEEEADAAYFNYFVALTNGMIDINLPSAFPEDEWLWALAGESIQAGPDFKFTPKVNLTEEAQAESVGSTLAATISYLASGKELSTVAKVTIGKAIGEAAGTAANIAWTYNEDAAIDAALLVEGAEDVYSRDAVAVTIDEENAELHDFAGKYSKFIDSAVEATVAEVAEDGTEKEVEGVVATLAADEEENVTLNIDGFEFDKTYKLTFVYELESIDITVEVLVNTIDRSRETVTLSMEHSVEYTHEPTIDATKESNEAHKIAPMNLVDKKLYDAIVSRDAETGVVYPVEADFYKSIFDDNKTFEDTKKVTVDNKLYWFGMDEETQTPTNIKGQIAFLEMLGRGAAYLGVNGADRTAYVRYHAESFNGSMKRIEYVQNYKTWYGQEVILKYTLNFTVPTKYDFVHSDAFVFSDNGYYSNVKPFYQTYADGKKFADTYTKAILAFSVYEVDMDAAFRVVEKDKDGNIVRYLTAEDLAAEHLTATFDFVEEPKDANIKFNGNKLSYKGKDESVRVAGKLTMSGDVVLPTSFDEGKAYAEYKVNQFNPLCDLSVNPDAPQYIEVTESQVYTINAIDYFDLFEAREGKKVAYVWKDLSKVNLIDHATGTWLLGNGTNGWYKNMTRTDIYGLTSEFKLISEIPAEYAQYFNWNEATGELTFNAKNQLQMANPIDVTIEMSVELPWAENKPAQVTITFGPKK